MTKQRVMRVLPTALASWQAMAAAISRMPLLFVVVIVPLTVAYALQWTRIETAITEMFDSWSLITLILEFGLLDVVRTVLLSALAIVILRFDLVGEVATRETFPGRGSRYAHFVALALGLVLLHMMYMTLFSLGSGSELHHIKIPTDIFAALQFLAFGVLSLAFLVFLPLFAAIAVDAPGAHFSNAVADTGRALVPMIGLYILVNLPILLFSLLAEYLWRPDWLPISPDIVIAFGRALLDVVWTTVMAAAAARTYACYGERLSGGRLPDLPHHANP